MWTEVVRSDQCIRRSRHWLMALVLLASGPAAHALSTDSEQPISILADRAEHDDATRITIYRGNVVIDQGSLHITGDVVTVNFDAHDQVTKITTVGEPAHFRQLPDGDTDHRKAWAQQMEYFPEQDLIMLSGEALYEKDGSRVQADRLVYDSRNSRFKALTDAASAASGDDDRARREEAGAGEDPDQAEEEDDTVEIRRRWRRSGELPRTFRLRCPFSPRADSRNATAAVSSSTMSASP